jgi:hypothetical protein
MFLCIFSANLISGYVVYAADSNATNVDFQIPKNVIAEKEEVEVIVEFTGGVQTDLFVKAVSDKGSAEIFNDALRMWVLSDMPWASAPGLSGRLKFRIEGVRETAVTVWFQIHNRKTGQTFESGKTTLQVSSEAGDYINKINLALKNWAAGKYPTGSAGKVIETLESTTSASADSKSDFNYRHALIGLTAAGISFLTMLAGLMLKYSSDPIKRFYQKVFHKLASGNTDDGADLSGFINAGKDNTGDGVG